MSDDTTDTDDTLRNRLRDRLSFNSADGDADEGTEQEGYSSDDHDEDDSFADAVGEETKNTIEQALTGETPTPDSSGGSEFSHDDLFSNDGSGDNGGE